MVGGGETEREYLAALEVAELGERAHEDSMGETEREYLAALERPGTWGVICCWGGSRWELAEERLLRRRDVSCSARKKSFCR